MAGGLQEPGTELTDTTDWGCKEAKERSAQLLTGGFPRPGSLELQTLILNKLVVGGDFGLCECV